MQNADVQKNRKLQSYLVINCAKPNQFRSSSSSRELYNFSYIFVKLCYSFSALIQFVAMLASSSTHWYKVNLFKSSGSFLLANNQVDCSSLSIPSRLCVESQLFLSKCWGSASQYFLQPGLCFAFRLSARVSLQLTLLLPYGLTECFASVFVLCFRTVDLAQQTLSLSSKQGLDHKCLFSILTIL